ncbi:hypothetical protein AYL99_04523 [Fonsecaea erecta]|uniref:Uncharacterized protein n=1 Tax=Fonsecaea erecta TaxID=1367422 RepID=A0A178ZR83_9EURO|nr:hypothetical protein AYL99_04523 [Fonsecaea erecta]OAP62320.1 hypothetical protein AYL99_04523 [Fonsecaea erecta]
MVEANKTSFVDKDASKSATRITENGNGATTTTSSATSSPASGAASPSPPPIAILKEAKFGGFNHISHGDRRKRLDAPPPLPFDLRDHVFSISIFTLLALAECCFVPIGLYYGLTYGTTLRPGLVFAVITSLFGFVSGYEFGMRSWRIMRYGDGYRPLYGSQFFRGFDATQYVLLTPFTVMTIILIIFSIPHNPSVKALALPMPVGMINLGLIFILNGIAAERRWRLMHFRLSSHVRNTVCPPLTFVFMEDVCAVDGKGGKKYRKAAMARYNASPQFRALLLHMLWFWSISATVVGAGLIAVIWLVSNDVAYGVGWGVPSVWALLWTWLTIIWVQRALRIEKATWVTGQEYSA